ncbi:hypothetical protein CBL_01668 [Carabus blaptoides fortunei]
MAVSYGNGVCHLFSISLHWDAALSDSIACVCHSLQPNRWNWVSKSNLAERILDSCLSYEFKASRYRSFTPSTNSLMIENVIPHSTPALAARPETASICCRVNTARLTGEKAKGEEDVDIMALCPPKGYPIELYGCLTFSQNSV